jgi:hypothetical protein
MQAVPQVQTAWTSSMDTITSTSTSTNTNTFYYLKWLIVVVILGYLAYILYPYLSIFVKLVELIRAFLMKAFKTKDVEPLDVGAKLAENKQEKKQAEANEGYCYMGEKDNVRQCARVDKSSCSSNFYSTESLCVNPS